jgi:hypothetical protein
MTPTQDEIVQAPLRHAENLARGVITRVEPFEPQLIVTELHATNTLLVGQLLSPDLRVSIPFLVTFKDDEGSVVAEAPAFNEFGFGEDRREALNDLQRAIQELHAELEERQPRLGADLLATWDSLRKHLRRK